MPECFVAKASELKDGDRRIVVDGKKEIGVFCQGGSYYAYSNYCVHAGGPACEGVLINKVVDVIGPDKTYQGQTFADELHFVCPWHGYEYDQRMRRRSSPEIAQVRRGPARRGYFRRHLIVP
jgi:nitrite reductase/ring-hydroxylating ferredoxin subunit